MERLARAREAVMDAVKELDEASSEAGIVEPREGDEVLTGVYVIGTWIKLASSEDNDAEQVARYAVPVMPMTKVLGMLDAAQIYERHEYINGFGDED